MAPFNLLPLAAGFAFRPEEHLGSIARELGSPEPDGTIFFDGVRVPALALRQAEQLAAATGKLHFLGFEWKAVPGDPSRRHRDTEHYLITTSREIALAHCGSFLWVSPFQQSEDRQEAQREVRTGGR